MKFLTVIILFFSLFRSCNTHVQPAPPCDPAFACVSIIQSNHKDCGNDYKIVAQNNSGKKTVSVIIFKEYNDEGGWYQIGNGEILRLGTNSQKFLGCSKQYINGKNREVRYRKGNACFDDDENCNQILPKNEDLPYVNCSPYFNCSSSCIEYDYDIISNPRQQNALSELYKSLLYRSNNIYNFQNDIVDSFTDSLNINCKNRTSSLNYSYFESTGNNPCEIKPLLTPSVVLYGTNDTYSKMWVNFPNVIQGKVNLNTSKNESTLFLNKEDGLSIDISVELEKNKTIRKDVIDRITAFKNERMLTISGHFICIKIKNMPQGD